MADESDLYLFTDLLPGNLFEVVFHSYWFIRDYDLWHRCDMATLLL